jgi:hypothetical protein
MLCCFYFKESSHWIVMQSYFNLDEESYVAKIQMEGAQIFLINLSQNAQGSSP